MLLNVHQTPTPLNPAREVIKDQRPKAVAESALEEYIVMRDAVRNRMQAPQCALHCDGYR